MTAQADTVLAAFDTGINFFFLTSDLHWPLYEANRRGLAKLFERGGSIRDEVVVAVVSYLEDPLFRALQVNEVIDAVPGLERVDVLLAGAIPNDASFYARLQSLERAKWIRHGGTSAIGASFHQRSTALLANSYDVIDVSYIRYNASHPGARTELFPYCRLDAPGLIYNFKSGMSLVSSERAAALGIPKSCWLPDAVDCYRFALARPQVDGVLCSPSSPSEVERIARGMERPCLRAEEEEYMIWLNSMAHVPVFG
jgi:aryl-alcohol dehydrogenase-like predicted oxidoreductase